MRASERRDVEVPSSTFEARRAEAARQRLAGAFYPPFVLLVIVATGNHFFFDAVTGALVVAASAFTPFAVTRAEPQPALLTLAPRTPSAELELEQAA